MTLADRIAPEACALRKQGLTLREVGARLGVSAQTVHYATWKLFGVQRRNPIDRHKGAANWRCWQCGSSAYGYSTRSRFSNPCRLQRWNENGTAHAQTEVAKAIKRGELKRPAEQSCVDCGKAAEQYDHRDYSKPLDVEPVCRTCNARRGPGKWVKHLPWQEMAKTRQRAAA